jgi:hypothetical protein
MSTDLQPILDEIQANPLDVAAELAAHREGVGHISLDRPGRGSPVHPVIYLDYEYAVYQFTHQKIPVWICADCIQMCIGATCPDVCPNCGEEGDVGEALTDVRVECSTATGSPEPCEITDLADCVCPVD